MMAATAFVGAFGLVSVGASECANATLKVAKQTGDVAVDSKGNVWFTANDDDNIVWMCPEDGECRSMGEGWDWPSGIAVDDSGDVPIVYVSEGDDHAPKMKKCMWNVGQADDEFSCSEFGSGWNSPRGLSLDDKGNVFITNAYGDRYGVWKCSPSADCTVIGDSDKWPHYPPESVAVDSQGNVYVTGGDEDAGDANYVKKCTSAGACSDFSGDWPKGGGYDNAIAVGPDDALYISDSGTNTLIRCSSDAVCENIGAFNGGVNMVIDQNGIFYVGDGYTSDGGLRKVCLPPSVNDIIV